MDKLLPSQKPPNNLKAEKIPQFFSIGFDDNDKSGFTSEKGIEGMKWAVDTFSSRKNPDGSNCSCAFYCTSQWITEGESREPPHLVKKSWKYALDNGFEIGCHTHSHPEGAKFDVDEWLFEMNKCVDKLVKPYKEGSDSGDTGIGIARSEIKSFRTPFLVYNANMLKAVQKMGFLYDCSLEEGYQDGQDGKNFYFPYTLDEGSPGNKFTHSQSPEVEEIGNHVGIWEIPTHVIFVPPDNLCEKYGIKKGLRKKCASEQNYFSKSDGKLTGFDYNCLADFQMTGGEFLATLKYTLDLRLEGNHAPFFLGAHTGIYSLEYESEPSIKISEQERRKAIEDFLDYALSKPEVYVVSPVKMIEWLRNPKEL
ncbi:MAG: polysaccharide deacetylase family protein [Treponema sp.]|jgi:peptidoglycan/xylan/chitin deacetylase (PgdA/CDA1 family)|nr:polysaccharide deacetylase family protein [Treponema sp.]